MTVTPSGCRVSQWGAIIIRQTNRDESDSTGGSTYVWAPAESIASELPHGFQLPLACRTTADGLRTFQPTIPCRDFSLLAGQAGLAVLSRLEGFRSRTTATPEELLNSYRLMGLVFQLAPRIREFLDRSIRRQQDLFIPSSGRLHSDHRDVFSDDIGATPDDPDRRWSVSDLMREGRRAAVGSGIANPTTETVIRKGLLEAARRNPFEVDQLSDAEITRLMRLILFDFGTATESMTAESHSLVRKRFLDLFERHLDDGTSDFNQWFIDGYENIVHAVSKRKCGGILARQTVREALLELIFDSFGHVAQCLDVFRRAFSDALSTPLCDDEQQLFDALFARQRWLGNLALILLCDLDVFQFVAAEFESDPANRDLQGVLLRTLYLHAEMLRNKRRSERDYKRQQPKRG